MRFSCPCTLFAEKKNLIYSQPCTADTLFLLPFAALPTLTYNIKAIATTLVRKTRWGVTFRSTVGWLAEDRRSAYICTCIRF